MERSKLAVFGCLRMALVLAALFSAKMGDGGLRCLEPTQGMAASCAGFEGSFPEQKRVRDSDPKYPVAIPRSERASIFQENKKMILGGWSDWTASGLP